MVARISTLAFQGMDAIDIDVQVQMVPGLPSFTIVGLANKAVAESRERIRASLSAIGLALPPRRIIVNLSPADMVKEGTHFDLPIALGLLRAMDVLAEDEVASYVAMGELALDGGLTPVIGVLPAAVHAASQGSGIICPAANGGQAAVAGEVNIVAADHLLTLVDHLKGRRLLAPPEGAVSDDNGALCPDLADVKGQESGKRALEIAAAGGHNLLFIGAPGAGKSMLAERMPGILPSMSAREAIEVAMLHSLSSVHGVDDGLCFRRPFRAPHHSASLPALVGGGARAKPGEISLAHNGVLFLDELPEFSRPAIEALRQPMESGQTLVARANAHISYPARFQLVAAMNPCRCGMLHDPAQACSRAPHCAHEYQAKISGPIYDRIDLHCEIAQVDPKSLRDRHVPLASSRVAGRVKQARHRQKQRYAKDGITLNSRAGDAILVKATALNAACEKLLDQAIRVFRLSARGYHRVLRTARTIADLDERENITDAHIAEALNYRRLPPKLHGKVP